ncbi:MAG: cyclic nucleotide-binding domain-containing protein [Muribaculaceae bacterium]|nr:cyclic nucleotide-binding domain-containing protein [Muribaculaceae bacterium]
MNTIYERLVNLPIFKGAGKELITSFVEKTPLDFISYYPGEVIIEENRPCDEVICLVSGSVRRRRYFCAGQLIVNDVLHAGSMLGLENLYGLHTKFGMNIVADSEVGVMQFDKHNLFHWLLNSKLLLINTLNYLSRNAQNGTDALMSHGMREIESELSYLVQIATSPSSTNISITTPNIPIEEFMAPQGKTHRPLLNRLIESGLITMPDSHTIDIASRCALLDAFREE